MTLKVGDIVANKFGHVLAVRERLETGKVVCFYQTNPEASHSYEEVDLRLLSHTHGIEVGGSKFMDLVKVCASRETPKVQRKVVSEEEKVLKSVSKGDLKSLLAKARERFSKIE